MNRKTLNINNSYRSDNCYPFLKDNIINRKTIDDWDKYKYEEEYLIDFTQAQDVQKVEEVLAAKPHVILVSDTVIPPNFLFAMGNNRESRTFLNYKEHYTKSETDNLRSYGQISQNGILVPVNSFDFNWKPLIFALNDFKYYLDNVIFMFNEDIPSEYKLELYHKLHEILARWRMRMCLSANNSEELEFLKAEYPKFI